MSLIINGSTLSTSSTATFNGSNLEKIIRNGSVVWEKQNYRQIYSLQFPSTGGAFISYNRTINRGGVPIQIPAGIVSGTITLRIVKPNQYCGVNNFTFQLGGVDICTGHMPSHIEMPCDLSQSFGVNSGYTSGGSLALAFHDVSQCNWTLYIDLTQLVIS